MSESEGSMDEDSVTEYSHNSYIGALLTLYNKTMLFEINVIRVIFLDTATAWIEQVFD